MAISTFKSLVFILLVGLVIPNILKAQEENTYSSAAESDPQAMDILSKISKRYKEKTAHKIDFSLEIELPAQGKETQKGMLLQQGENFSLDMDGRTIISDGETVWMYMADLNEVQINDADFDDEGEFTTPSDIFDLHNSGDYVFAVSNQFEEEGVAITQIEGKPLDEESDYSKMRLTVINKGLGVKRLKIFSKDGSRFTMNILKHNDGWSPPVGTFSFDASKYEGVHVEDLRF